jgi:hypothetical protein
MRVGRLVTEAGVLAYLLCIPLGQSIGASGRNLALLTIVLGMVLARLPGGLDRPPAFQLVVPFVFFAASTLCSVVFSTYRELSLTRAALRSVRAVLRGTGRRHGRRRSAVITLSVVLRWA